MAGRRSRDHHLPHRVYHVRSAHWYVDPAGKWHRLGTAWDAAAKSEWLRLTTGRAPDGTVAKLLDEYLRAAAELVRRGQRAHRTQADQEVEASVLKRVFGRMDVAAVTSRHVAAYLAKRCDSAGTPAPVRANREIALLSSAYSWGMRQDNYAIERNPCYGVRRNPEHPRSLYVESAELVRFGRRHCPAWLRGYLVLKRLTGLRQGDMLALTRAALTDRGLLVTTHKTGRTLLFRWSWALRIAVRWILRQHGEIEALCLFPARKRAPMTAHGLKSAWARAMKAHGAAGGQRFAENDIRAKTGSDSASLTAAQERLGHDRSSTTARHYRRSAAKVTPLR